MAYVILDGKVFAADRYGEKTVSVKGKPIDLWYSGKAHEYGGNIYCPTPERLAPGSDVMVNRGLEDVA